MKVLFAASEAVPFCKTGGLADVVTALCQALAAEGHRVVLILPLYKSIKKGPYRIKRLKLSLDIPFEGRWESVGLWECNLHTNFKVYFVESNRFFDRDGLYGSEAGKSYPDNDLRYILYALSVFSIIKAVRFKPDVIHCHDWQAGLIPAYLETTFRKAAPYSHIASVFTIHNLAYQGHFPKASFEKTGLPSPVFNIEGVEFYGHLNFMKAALMFSDAINTVSPTYAKQVQTDPKFGHGMEGVLQKRRDRFRGILNGLDTHLWNPMKDKYLAVPFDAQRLKSRSLCREDLQKAAGLPANPMIPILGFVGRLDPQKGVDLIIEAAPAALESGAQLIVVGVGPDHYRQTLLNLRRQYPTQVFIETSFAEPLAHKIYGGADLFLMPSRFEPCGLGQMIAMRYGTIPVVTPTGGLLDTVKHIPSDPEGTGFVSSQISGSSLRSVLLEALAYLANKSIRTKIQKRIMNRDYSWKNSVKAYEDLYRDAARWSREGAQKL